MIMMIDWFIAYLVTMIEYQCVSSFADYSSIHEAVNGQLVTSHYSIPRKGSTLKSSFETHFFVPSQFGC